MLANFTNSGNRRDIWRWIKKFRIFRYTKSLKFSGEHAGDIGNEIETILFSKCLANPSQKQSFSQAFFDRYSSREVSTRKYISLESLIRVTESSQIRTLRFYFKIFTNTSCSKEFFIAWIRTKTKSNSWEYRGNIKNVRHGQDMERWCECYRRTRGIQWLVKLYSWKHETECHSNDFSEL